MDLHTHALPSQRETLASLRGVSVGECFRRGDDERQQEITDSAKMVQIELE